MLLKNPWRITELLDIDSSVSTIKGDIPAKDWCEQEANRLRSAGIAAKAVTKNGKCYVVRPREGCRIEEIPE